MTISVFLVDDQDLVRAGLALVVASQPDLAVVGQAADGDEAVAMAAALVPDVACLDVRMPGRTALSGSTETARPASTAATTALEFQLE